MKIAEYQAAARMTAVYPMEAAITYPAIGLIGELAEYCEKRAILDPEYDSDAAELSKELSDVLWYCANLSLDLSSSIAEAIGATSDVCFDEVECRHCFDNEVLLIAGRCAEATKKWIRDGFRPELRTWLLNCVRDTMMFIAQEAADIGIHLDDVAEVNLAKLKSRQERGVLKGDGDNR